MPDNVGGRYSVLTAVGLLPIAVAGMDIDALHAPARRPSARMRSARSRTYNSPACAVRHAMPPRALYALRQEDRAARLLTSPSFRFMAEWWKQLYGESEGKDGKGIFPASVDLTADLHSMGQYIQDGIAHAAGDRRLLRTPIPTSSPSRHDDVNRRRPELSWRAETMGFINRQGDATATQGSPTSPAASPSPRSACRRDRRAKPLGELIYFFEFACGLSGYHARRQSLRPARRRGLQEEYVRSCSASPATRRPARPCAPSSAK